MSFGGGADGPRGFLPRKSAGKRALVRGSVLDVVLTGEKKDAGAVGKSRVLHATADPKRVASVVTHESDGTVMSTLLPGMLVNARVRSVLSDGVSVNFMTYFVATADAFHAGTRRVPARSRTPPPRIRTTRTSRASDAARACCTSTPRPNASDSPFDLDFCVSVSATRRRTPPRRSRPAPSTKTRSFVASIPPWASSSNSPETPRRARAWDTATSATPPTIAWINSSVDFASVRRFARASSGAARLTRASPSWLPPVHARPTLLIPR